MIRYPDRKHLRVEIFILAQNYRPQSMIVKIQGRNLKQIVTSWIKSRERMNAYMLT